jgi:2-dehydropantoate 2-reductase
MMQKSKDNKRMRFIIYGAGAIGGVVGGHLVLAGNDVILIGRSGHVNAIREQGLKFVTPSGVHVLRVPAATAPGEIKFGENDVVLLTMKSQNTEEALQDLRTVVRDVPVFCLQNGVRNEETAARYFPRVYGSFVRVGGEYLRDGEVICRRDPPGWLIMGCYPSGKDELVEAVAGNLRQAGFFMLVTPDVMPYKWGKLMLNLGNAIGAITNARDGDNGRIGAAVRREAQEILSQAGVRWISEEQLAVAWPESTERPRGVLKTEGQSSTWQSLARRQGTAEVEFLNGEIVRVAQRLGKQAPLNEALSRIVQEMAAKRELPGKYTPGELFKLLGLV